MTNFDPSHTFITSDHHFGSWKKFIAFKVFSEDEEKTLIDKWNSTVCQNDTVIYNGDFHDCDLSDLIEYRKKLNGNIILIKGNHDEFSDDIYKSIFQDVLDELFIDQYNLLIHHCPCNLKSPRNQIFGHIHRHQFIRDKYVGFCSCVQFNDGYPISLEKILEKLDNKFVRKIADK